MRVRTAAAVAVVVAALAGVVLLGVGVPADGGDLTERWTSDTARQNERNHHAVGASADGSVVVAPVAEVPNAGTPLTNTSCTLARLNASDGAVEWRTTVPPGKCFTHALSEPAIADLDGDGSAEVVSSSIENALVAYDATDGSERWRVPLSADEPSYGYGRPTVADLPLSSGREVVVSSIHGDVAAVAANGSVAWRASFADVGTDDAVVQQRPLVVDADGDGAEGTAAGSRNAARSGDGSLDVVVGSSAGLLVLNHDGSVAWNRSTPSPYVVATQADDDPARELLAGDGRTLAALDGATGAPQWTVDPESALRYREVSDGDGDGADELYAGTFAGTVVAVDVRSGDVEWRSTVTADDAPVWSPVTADLDGDGEREVVATSRDGSVTVLAGDGGRVLATFERTVSIETHATPADLDGDGTPELLVRYSDGRVVALDYAA